MPPGGFNDGLAINFSGKSLFHSVFRLASVAQPNVQCRWRLNVLRRLGNQRAMFFNGVYDGLARRGEGVVQPFARYQRFGERHVRAVMRIFARASIHCNFHGVRVHNYRGPSVHFLRLEETSLCVFSTFGRAGRADLDEGEGFARLVRGSNTTVDLDGVSIAITSNANGYPFLVAGRFKVGHALQGHSAICHGVQSVLSPTGLVSCLERTFLASSAFSHRRCERIYEDRLGDRVGNAIRSFAVTCSTGAGFCALCL